MVLIPAGGSSRKARSATNMVRQDALTALLSRLDEGRLAQLLDNYPARPGKYYYNVMTELDLRL